MTSGVPVTNRLVVVIPVYDDWESVMLLLPQLDAVLATQDVTAEALLVDDCSTRDRPASLGTLPLSAIQELRVLRLRRNLGHQRAIAIGLTHVEGARPDARALVMDGDGEDQPSDVPALLAESAANPTSIVFAARRKRSESVGFRVGYALYRGLHRALTGLSVNVGNFSVLPPRALRTLVVVSELWNHYAAAVFRARIPYRLVPTARGKRLAGTPTMNYVTLTAHGLSALAVHGEVVGARMFLASAGLAVCAAAALVSVVYVRLFTPLAIPGWATNAAGLAAVLLIQLLGLAVLFAFVILTGRSNANFIPLRDYGYFIDRLDVVIGPATPAARPSA